MMGLVYHYFPNFTTVFFCHKRFTKKIVYFLVELCYNTPDLCG